MIAGLALIFAAGLLSGLFTIPMKFVSGGWKFEHIWLIYATFGILIFPWLLAYLTVPDLIGAYSAVSHKTVVLTVVFGALWGVGSTLFGMGSDAIGNALAFSIILGLAAALGSAIPLLVLHTSEAIKQQGLCTWGGLVINSVGLYFLAKSGIIRERERLAGEKLNTSINKSSETSPLIQEEGPKSKTSFRVGLIYCLLSGVFSAMLNLALAFGKDIQDVAQDQGASKTNSNNSVWALAISSGYLANAGYCIILLFQNNSWGGYLSSGALPCLWNTFLAFVMGASWFGGNVMYGAGTNMTGDLGTVIGFPVFLCGMIMAANFAAVATGEWTGTSNRPRIFMAVGLAILLVAVVVISLGGVDF